MKKEELLKTPPEGIACDLRLKDTVTYVNSYGCVFHGMEVIGFSVPEKENGDFIHLDFSELADHAGAAWWMPHKREELTHDPGLRLRMEEMKITPEEQARQLLLSGKGKGALHQIASDLGITVKNTWAPHALEVTNHYLPGKNPVIMTAHPKDGESCAETKTNFAFAIAWAVYNPSKSATFPMEGMKDHDHFNMVSRLATSLLLPQPHFRNIWEESSKQFPSETIIDLARAFETEEWVVRMGLRFQQNPITLTTLCGKAPEGRGKLLQANEIAKRMKTAATRKQSMEINSRDLQVLLDVFPQLLQL